QDGCCRVRRAGDELHQAGRQAPDPRCGPLDSAGASDRGQRTSDTFPDGAGHDRRDDMTEATLEDSEVQAAANDAKSAGRRAMLAGAIVPTLMRLALPTITVLV